MTRDEGPHDRAHHGHGLALRAEGVEHPADERGGDALLAELRVDELATVVKGHSPHLSMLAEPLKVSRVIIDAAKAVTVPVA
nr:hypothetical protein [Glaciihabitans sp. dw_435]